MKKNKKIINKSSLEKFKIGFLSIIAIAGSVFVLNLSMTFAERNSGLENLLGIVGVSVMDADENAQIEAGNDEDSQDDILEQTDNPNQDGAEILSETVWDMESVSVYTDEETLPTGHISFDVAVNKAYLYVKEIAGVDVSDTYISVHQENECLDEEYVGDDNINRVYIDVYFDYSEDGTDDKYIVMFDAVTGQIRGYAFYENKGVTDQECIDNKIIIDGYRESELGYGVDDYENNPDAVDEFWGEEMTKAIPKYNEIAVNYVKDVLKEGEVTDFYGHSTSSGDRETGKVYYFTVQCETAKGALQITIDQMTGQVIEYLRV